MYRPDDNDERIFWASGTGRVEISLLAEHAEMGYHQGACDDDIRDLRAVPSIAFQLSALNKHDVRDTLHEYGAWSDEELQDHDANLSRLLWIACADAVEEKWNKQP